MSHRILLSPPHMGGSEKKYVEDAFNSNWIVPMGPNINGFENDLEIYFKNEKKILCVSSGTSSIHLALNLSDVKNGDEVLCQSFTFAASANPITYLGAKPVFIDSEKDTWNMCPKTLEKAINDRIDFGVKPKAIIVVHLYGMPAKIDKISSIAKKYKINLIEDSAEALGSSFKQRKCGSFGDYGVLSFNGNKIITTSGGGALICNSIEQKNKALFLATQAKDNAPHYQHSVIGYNYRMSNVSAGIGRGQMEVLDKHVQLRRNNNEFYKNLFRKIEGISVFEEYNKDFFSNHWLTCITIDKNKCLLDNNQLRILLEKNNIESRPLWKPLHLQPVFKNCTFYGTGVSEYLFNNGLCLPSGSSLKKFEKEKISKIINNAFK
tara:strand:- start:721 stop:1854 length:1134 start_codon:yes stop_codon:yes gene_type:complete